MSWRQRTIRPGRVRDPWWHTRQCPENRRTPWGFFSLSKLVKKKIDELKQHPRTEKIKETGSKKSVQFGLLALATIISQLLKTVNKEVFDFLATFFVFLFVLFLVGIMIFLQRRDTKLRKHDREEVKREVSKKETEWLETCRLCAQSNESLVFELKEQFDRKLVETEGQFEVIIESYRCQVNRCLAQVINERRWNCAVIALLGNLDKPHGFLDERVLEGKYMDLQTLKKKEKKGDTVANQNAPMDLDEKDMENFLNIWRINEKDMERLNHAMVLGIFKGGIVPVIVKTFENPTTQNIALAVKCWKLVAEIEEHDFKAGDDPGVDIDADHAAEMKVHVSKMMEEKHRLMEKIVELSKNRQEQARQETGPAGRSME